MRKAALIYNPASGRRRAQRADDVDRAAAVLRAAGVETLITPTLAADTAGQQARDAIAQGCDVIFACGGDGTVNDIVQGMAGGEAALGLIPLGTGNALGNDLCLPLRDPVRSAQAALNAGPARIALGRIHYQHASGAPACRYFIVTAGIGADAALLYKMSLNLKDRIGMTAYYTEAMRVWATHDYPAFEVEFSDTTGPTRREIVSEVLAVRIRYFGGLLRCLAPGANLRRNHLRLVLFKTGSRFPFLHYTTRNLAGRKWPVRGVELADATQVRCRPLSEAVTPPWGKPHAQRPIYAEADGELLGRIPAEVSVLPDALTLLIPRLR